MLVIIQNDPEVPAGAYAAYLKEAGVPFRVVKPFSGEELPLASGVSAAIVLGGAMGVHDTESNPFLADVKGFIREAVVLEKPFLGICLGGQLLADVLGARVTSDSPYGEKGTLPVTLTGAGVSDPLFEGIEREFISFQWHNDSFAVPQGGVHLASSAACPNQAFRFGRTAYGTQFHPEVTLKIVEAWSSLTPETAERTGHFLAGFENRADVYHAASSRLLANFLRIARLA